MANKDPFARVENIFSKKDYLKWSEAILKAVEKWIARQDTKDGNLLPLVNLGNLNEINNVIFDALSNTNYSEEIKKFNLLFPDISTMIQEDQQFYNQIKLRDDYFNLYEKTYQNQTISKLAGDEFSGTYIQKIKNEVIKSFTSGGSVEDLSTTLFDLIITSGDVTLLENYSQVITRDLLYQYEGLFLTIS